MQICEKNENIMCTAMKTYKRFSRLLIEEGLSEDESVNFREICRRARVSPVDMNEILMEELGVDGETMLERMRGK